MNANHELDRRLADFYAGEAPQRAPDRVLEGALATIDRTSQRRALVRVPWRIPTMNTYARFAAAAVAVIAIGAVGFALLRPDTSPSVGGQPLASPSLLPPAGGTPSASPIPPPDLTETFTSERNGFSISYPTGWIARPATEPWLTGVPNFESTDGDVLYDPTQDTGHLWIMVASQPLNETGGEQWVDDLLTRLSSDGICEPPNERVTIDGAQGGKCASSVAAVVAGGRGYLILLYVSGDDPAVGLVYDQQYFQEILETIQLIPEDSPSPSLLPSLTETFSSPTNAIAVSYPTGWQVETATTEWTTGIPLQGDSFRDLISHPERENTFLLIASQALGLRTGEQFVTDIATDPTWGDGACQPTTESTPLNGISASLVTRCDGTLTAVASHGDRGYLIVLFGMDDVALFRAILASAQMG
jgi:hypothetical protein